MRSTIAVDSVTALRIITAHLVQTRLDLAEAAAQSRALLARGAQTAMEMSPAGPQTRQSPRLQTSSLNGHPQLASEG
jgi:hypothetical protein